CYADDFIISVKGEYDKAEWIKNQVTQWLNLRSGRTNQKLSKLTKGQGFSLHDKGKQNQSIV
ncbi:hypothetical protein, partial [Candidatus Phytoplasma crotalariae]|uniref:hypothetical protein n=1 Tax=Candidatus Phytoplasma crotalariae TaxID=2982627 RepID=UPI00271491F8